MADDKNIYLISGNDPLIIREKSRRLFEKLAGEEPDTFATDVFAEGENGADPELIFDVIRSVRTPPMFGDRKTVWLKHCSCLGKESADKSAPFGKALRELAQLIKDGVPPEVVLLVDGPGVDRRKALFKACSARGEVQFYEKPDMAKRNWQVSVREYVEREIAARSMRFSPNALNYLLTVLGTDTARTGQELEKIICWRGNADGVVNEEEVRQVCVGKGEEMAWALGEKLGQRNWEEILRIIDVLIAQNGNNDGYARAMLLAAGSFFRTGIRLRVFMAQRRLGRSCDVGNALSRMDEEEKERCRAQGFDFVDFHPFRVQMLSEQALRYTPRELVQGVHLCRRMLLRITESGISPRLALEMALEQVVCAGMSGMNQRMAGR